MIVLTVLKKLLRVLKKLAIAGAAVAGGLLILSAVTVAAGRNRAPAAQPEPPAVSEEAAVRETEGDGADAAEEKGSVEEPAGEAPGVPAAFCAAVGSVVETDTMEFVADSSGVWSYGPTGVDGTMEFRKYLEIGVKAMMVHEYETNQYELSGLDRYDNAPTPAWMFAPMTAVAFYLEPVAGEMRKITYIDHDLYEDVATEEYPLPRHLGRWLLWNGNAYWRGDDPIGSAEIAVTADLITETMAVRTEYHGAQGRETVTRVFADSACGGNERLLFKQEGAAELDAMTDEVLLYHVGGRHLVYHFASGEITENPYVGAEDILVGYSSTAVYLKAGEAGGLSRIAVDYDAL